MAFSDFQSKLDRAIESKYVYRTTYTPRASKSDVLEYYKQEYGKAGTRKAAEKIHELGLVVNKKTGEVPKVESLMRRFQTRGGKSQGETSAVYAALGKELPAKATHSKVLPNQYTIRVEGKQGMRERKFTAVTFKGSDAREFAENPSFEAYFEKLKYPDSVIERFDQGEEEGGSDTLLEVTFVG